MTSRLIAIRPEPGLAETISAAKELGLECFGEALFRVQSCDWNSLDLPDADGLLIGSANAIRHGGEQLEKLIHLPVYAVGERTAEYAREAGFQVAQTGQGGLQYLIDQFPGNQANLLRLTGQERVPLNVPPQLSITEREVYKVNALPMSAELQAMLSDEALVLIHSAAAARHFAEECERCSIDRARISLTVLGPRIAQAVGDNWSSIAIANQPNDAVLLKLAAEICQ